MKKVLAFIYLMCITIAMQFLLVKTVYPWIYDWLMSKNSLTTFAIYATAVIEVIVVAIFVLKSEELTVFDFFLSPLIIMVITLVGCVVLMMIIDVVWCIFENIFAIIWSMLIVCAIFAVIFGDPNNGHTIEGIFWWK